MDISIILKLAISSGASDVHFMQDARPVLRVDGKIQPIPNAEVLTDDACAELCASLCVFAHQKRLKEVGDCDFSYVFACDDGHAYRFRGNAFRVSGKLAFALRLIKGKIPTMDALCMPPTLKRLTEKQHGLIAVTGPTGSGKSTTLSAMLRLINETYPYHIITIEDPIEYIHSPKQAIIHQREVGPDVSSFYAGLTAALRQDPDVIFVGEMRDRETVETALHAAETGHLVLTTLHASSVIEAVDRILQYFRGDEQRQVQAQLANCFEAIIAQKLFSRKNAKGRVAALEILTRNPAATNLIRTGQAYQLQDCMRTTDGMQTMEDAIKDLRMKNMI